MMFTSEKPLRPPMPTRFDQLRSEHQSLRERMLSGEWQEDLERAIRRHISIDRRPQWGIPEGSRSAFRSLCSQIGGVLYQRPPKVRGDEGLIERMANAQYWSLMQNVAERLVGLREFPMRVDYSYKFGRLIYRPMAPHDVYAVADPEDPETPTLIAERQPRLNPERNEWEWVWEVLDIGGPEPHHYITNGDRTADLTDLYLPGLEGYQYIDRRGKPYLPIIWYHAARTGKLWNSWYGAETVMGTLTTGVLLTFWVHGVKDGSFSTVMIVNGRINGVTIHSPNGETTTRVISSEPGAYIEVSPQDEGLQPQIVQLKPGMDPEKLMKAINLYEAGHGEYAGVPPADVIRTGADPRSGVSLSISREGLRTAQAKMEPQLRRADIQVARVTARILNAFEEGANYAEEDYEVLYPTLAKSPQEIDRERADIVAKMSHGLMSRVDAIQQLNAGMSREAAILEIQRIDRDRSLFGTGAITE